MTKNSYYLYPHVARMLLAMSKLHRVKTELRRSLREQHWSDSAAAELAEIHVRLEKSDEL